LNSGPDLSVSAEMEPTELALVPTQLGYACARSGLPPEETLRVAHELYNAHRNGVVASNDLHILYLLINEAPLRDEVVRMQSQAKRSAWHLVENYC